MHFSAIYSDILSENSDSHEAKWEQPAVRSL